MTEEVATVIVVGAYHVFLNRSPEFTGLRDWVQYLMDGMTPEEFIEKVKQSDEYKAKWAA